MSAAVPGLRRAREMTLILEGNHVTSCKETTQEDAEAQGQKIAQADAPQQEVRQRAASGDSLDAAP